MRLLHLSDLHFCRSTIETDTTRNALADLLADCRHVPEIDLVVVTGDIADDGSVEACATAQAMVAAFAQERRASQVWCVGNHDARAAFTSVFGSGHVDCRGVDVGESAPNRLELCAATSSVRGWRVVSLDTLVPGQVPGRLDAEQLEWLRQILREPAAEGTVLAFHHPPVSTSPEWAAANLQEPQELADVIRGSDVRVILCGHVHAQIAASFAGIPVWVTPGVANRIDLTAPQGVVRAVGGASATVVDLDRATGRMFHLLHARDPDAGAQIYLKDGRTWQPLASEDG